MAQILAVALHISSCVVRRLQQDHTVLLRLTHMSCPPGPAPRGSGPARPQGLPNSSLPGLSVPRCLQARIHREPGTGGACDLLHCQQMKVCSSLGAVGLLSRLGRAQTRGVVSPQLRGFSWLLLQQAPEQRQCTVPTAQQVRWSWAAPKRGSGAAQGGTVGLSSRHPRACPSDGCFCQVSAGHRRWRFLGPAANPPFGPAGLHTGSRGWHLLWLVGSGCRVLVCQKLQRGHRQSGWCC